MEALALDSGSCNTITHAPGTTCGEEPIKRHEMRLGGTAACQSRFEKLVMPLAGNKFVVTVTAAMTKMFLGVPDSCCQFRLAIIFVLMRETLRD